MSKVPLQSQPNDEYLKNIKSRFGDLYEPTKESRRWSVFKDRLAILALILVLAFLVFIIFDGWVVNFRCTFGEFVTFECNRWAGEEHPRLRK